MPPNKQTSPSNWYQHLEANRQFIIGSIVLVCVVLVAASSLKNPTDYDGYWHLKMGKDWVENGLNPYQDHYSFTYYGHDINSPPVMFQIGLYTLVNWLGEWGGFVTIKLLASFLAIGCMFAWLKQIKAPALAYCIVFPILAIVIELRSQVRPELFTYCLFIISFMLYQRAQLKLTFRAIAPIALLLLFWSNYHTSILGYVIFFGLFIDIGLKLIHEKAGIKTWLIWAAWGAVLVGVGFLKPGLTHPVWGSITFDNAWKSQIAEYRPPFIIYKNILSLYILLIVGLATLILAIYKRKLGYILCCGLLLYAGATMGRMVTPAGIIILAMFAHLLSDTQIKNALCNRKNKLFRFSGPVIIAALLLTMYESVANVRGMLHSNQSLTTLFPKHLIKYMIDNNKSGRIFNAYGMGGYLIYHLSPESNIYIDGRTNILYPLEHMQRWRTVSSSANDMKIETKLYDFDFAILHSTARKARLMHEANQLSLDFVDINYALYSKENASLSATGKLWAEPYCWDMSDAEALNEELKTKESNIINVPIRELLELAKQYTAAEENKNWIIKLDTTKIEYDEAKRFVGYRALEQGLNKVALELFSSIIETEKKDRLAISLAYLRNNELYNAEKELVEPTETRDPKLNYNDQIILQGILSEIKKQQPLSPAGEELLIYISNIVSDNTLEIKENTVSVTTFCKGT